MWPHPGTTSGTTAIAPFEIQMNDELYIHLLKKKKLFSIFYSFYDVSLEKLYKALVEQWKM